MAAIDSTPLDERQYHRPDIIQWWVNEGHGRPMDQNFIHRYFSESPFFDWTSRNGHELNLGGRDWIAFQRTMNRQEFEKHLRSRAGLEYMIVAEPQPVNDKELAAQCVTTGVYVIRKQNRELVKKDQILEAQRRKRPSVIYEPHENGRDMWEVTVLGTYYIVGEAAYQAPNVFDMVGNRLTSAAARLNKVFDLANALPRYSPAVGHTYLPPRTSTRPTNATGSVVGTPARSREGSIAPDESSLRSASVHPESQTASAAEANFDDTKLLLESLGLVAQHGDEFTDENPLLGEPGNFRYTSSMAAVKKRRQEEEEAAARERAEQEALKPTKEVANVFSDPTPKKAAKGGKDKDERKPSKSDKKRKKSRANISGTATSPTTPSSATSIHPPDSAL